jgi:hypothetical protein
MKYERLSVLLDQVQQDLEKQSYFLMNANKNVLSTQRGAVRVNCIDNLDRTNVVQSLFARYVLNQQLIRLGLIPEGQSFSSYPQFEATFKHGMYDELWKYLSKYIFYSMGQ